MARVHTVAYFENQDGAGAITELAALDDPLSEEFVVSGDNITMNAAYPFIVGVYAGLDHTVEPRARLVHEPWRAKELLGRDFFEIPELNSGAEPGSPPKYNDYRHTPIRVVTDRALQFESVNNPIAVADQFALVQMSDGPVAPVDPRGGFWIRAVTAASAMTVNTWNRRVLTLDDDVYPGTYDLLGFRGISTSLIALAPMPAGQTNHLAFLGRDLRADLPHPAFEPGAWGTIATFRHDRVPPFKFLVDAADNEIQVVDLFLKPRQLL